MECAIHRNWYLPGARAQRRLDRVRGVTVEAAARAIPVDDPLAKLTPREWAVARCIAAGDGNRAIGERLGITEQTVKNHCSAIFAKFGIRGRDRAGKRARVAYLVGLADARKGT